jgi:hypothetical protein
MRRRHPERERRRPRHSTPRATIDQRLRLTLDRLTALQNRIGV